MELSASGSSIEIDFVVVAAVVAEVTDELSWNCFCYCC